MIALLDDLPLVRLADGSTAPFEHDWLLRALNSAARSDASDPFAAPILLSASS